MNKMNVLFIAVDDLRPQLGCYGQDFVQSPHIDQLAAEGVLFKRAYCQQAVCAPSRASVLSGCRPDTTTIYDLQTPLRSVMPDVLSLPQHFKQHGYETRSIGKIYHHRSDDLQGWTTQPHVSTGDWKGRGYLTDEAMEVIERTDAQLATEGSTRRGLGPAFEAADVPDDAYHDGKDADHAIKTLNELCDQPFFLAVGFHKPHLPFNAPKSHWDRYDRDALPLALNTSAPENVTEYSLTEFGELRGYFGMPKEGPIPEDLARTLVHGYCACVSYMDAQVGRVLGELERLGLKDNTVVILWGDHGWKLGEHGSWCKHTNFDIDTHAPMIIRSPERGKTGAKAYGLTEFVDMYPSLCDLCDLPLPDHLEGQSFVPLMEDPDRTWKQAAFSQYPRSGVMGYTIKTDDFRYTEWQSRETGEVKARELYDHREDAAENINVAEDICYAETVSELEKVLQKGWEAARA